MGGEAGVSNNEFVPYLENPISSSARAIGTAPPSIYCEYIKTIPCDLLIEDNIYFIFPLYFPISSKEKILPNFSNVESLYLNLFFVFGLKSIVLAKPFFPNKNLLSSSSKFSKFL